MYIFVCLKYFICIAINRGFDKLGRLSAIFNNGGNCVYEDPSEKGSTLKEKNLLRSKFISFRIDPFRNVCGAGGGGRL